MRTAIILIVIVPGVMRMAASAEPAAGPEKLVLNARSRLAQTPRKVLVRTEQVTWQANQTAIIICDMWNKHWCKGATRRVVEMAPRMNEFVGKARERGALIVHAPSGCMRAYKDHPARKRAQAAPRAKNLPPGIARGGRKVATEKGAKWPIDQSDGGCDCQPKCPGGGPWRSQIDTIEIRDEDAISDSGVEIWNLFEQRGVKNVMLVGVHTNMCVIGRPFGLRNMVRCGKNVVLVRDMTDTMYNSRRWPFVSHVCGTYLIVRYIETYVCPTITSSDLTGKPPFVFSDHFAEPARPGAGAGDLRAKWSPIRSGIPWDGQFHGAAAGCDGFAWYRCFVKVPQAWAGKELTLRLGMIDDCDVTYLNGRQVGASGSVPPKAYQSATNTHRKYAVPVKAVQPGRWNLIALRVYDGGGRGGFKSAGQALVCGREQIKLEGTWLFRLGDKPDWAKPPAALKAPKTATFTKVQPAGPGR